jgi:alanine racemase
MLLHGRRVGVVGHVTMDMTMIDVTDVPCEVGDMVTVLGADGDDVITAEELATLLPASPYELLTGLHLRLARRYSGALA